MNLKAYLKTLDTSEQEDFAQRCETSLAYLKKIAGGFAGANAPGEKLAINIERESCGQVPCEESRSDVDWAYIRGTAKSDDGEESSLKKTA
jgi:DNA-binding transcriptional regulator YdaS (Cro superfamily)